MPTDELKYFFAYEREDTEFVLELAKKLRGVGANVWLDQLDILGGQHWDRAVERALETCRGMIAVLSPESLASDNVMDEVSYALERGKPVVPLLLRSCDVPFRLRRVQHVDFTAGYDAGFSQLLRALHIEQLPVRTIPTEPQSQAVNEHEEPSTELTAAAERKLPETQAARHTVKQADPVAIGRTTALPERMTGALTGGAAGAVFGMISVLLSENADEWFLGAGIVGITGAITGLITGTERRLIVAAMAGMVVGFILALSGAVSFGYEGVFAAIFGAPTGALLGAIVGVVVKKMRG